MYPYISVMSTVEELMLKSNKPEVVNFSDQIDTTCIILNLSVDSTEHIAVSLGFVAKQNISLIITTSGLCD